MWVLIYFGDETLVWGIIGKYIFLYGWFPFHFADIFFSHAEAFYFGEASFVLSFMSLALGDILVKILLHGISEIFLPIFSSRSFIHLEFIFECDVSWWSSFIEQPNWRQGLPQHYSNKWAKINIGGMGIRREERNKEKLKRCLEEWEVILKW